MRISKRRGREAASALEGWLMLNPGAPPMLQIWGSCVPGWVLASSEEELGGGEGAVHCASGNLHCPSLFRVFREGSPQTTFSHAHHFIRVLWEGWQPRGYRYLGERESKFPLKRQSCWSPANAERTRSKWKHFHKVQLWPSALPSRTHLWLRRYHWLGCHPCHAVCEGMNTIGGKQQKVLDASGSGGQWSCYPSV